MPFENGVNWQPIEPEKRGRYKTFDAAVDAVFRELSTERNGFFESLADEWKRLFPTMPARPGRYEDGKIFIYVDNSSANFVMRPKLAAIRRELEKLPNAPKRLDLRLEIHAR